MARSFLRVVMAGGLLATGWGAAQAQKSEPDFELLVDAPGGATTITCVRGCTLSWVERGVNPRARAIGSFDYECTGSRCSSGRVGGWIAQ